MLPGLYDISVARSFIASPILNCAASGPFIIVNLLFDKTASPCHFPGPSSCAVSFLLPAMPIRRTYDAAPSGGIEDQKQSSVYAKITSSLLLIVRFIQFCLVIPFIYFSVQMAWGLGDNVPRWLIGFCLGSTRHLSLSPMSLQCAIPPSDSFHLFNVKAAALLSQVSVLPLKIALTRSSSPLATATAALLTVAACIHACCCSIQSCCRTRSPISTSLSPSPKPSALRIVVDTLALLVWIGTIIYPLLGEDPFFGYYSGNVDRGDYSYYMIFGQLGFALW